MAISLLNNISALEAQNQLNITQTNLQKTLFQLSSGSRINSGADDAAGLAIANGLAANITALTQSSANANTGVGSLQVADGVLGLTVLEPIVNIDSHFDTPGVVLRNNGLGFGDTVFGPYFQSLPVISGGRPVFSYRLEFDTIAPTGAFDSHRDLNQGSGFWSIIPYFAFTALPTPELEISARIHYLYNFETSRAANPPPIPGFDFVNGQAGQATWINFASSYAVAPWVSLGVNGFYLKQLTNDIVNGSSLSGTRKEELYLGPGMHFPFDGTNANILNVNAYFPVETKGLAQGPQITAQFIHVF